MLNPKSFKSVRYNDIEVFYLPKLNGGGTTFEQDFVRTVRDNIGKVKRVCEFCSGPGFIGFALLANGLCDELCLVDVNPQAIEVCNYTILVNNLKGKVKAYVSDSLSSVPDKEKWDLIVSNPPHFDGSVSEYKNDLIAIDPDWYIHKQFYSKVGKFMNKNSSILFLENNAGSDIDMWIKMARQNKLKFVRDLEYDMNQKNNDIAKVAFEKVIESIGDGTFFSKGITYYINGFKKLIGGTYKDNKFYYVWIKNSAAKNKLGRKKL